MAVKTPKHWQNEELIKATTAYGHEVMIPKKIMKGWEGLTETHELALKNGADLSIGVEEYNHTASVQHERRNAILVFYEKYQRDE